MHWCILSRFTNTDSLDNYFNFTFTCALLGFNPIYLDGLFLSCLDLLSSLLSRDILGVGNICLLEPFHSFIFNISAYFSVCH